MDSNNKEIASGSSNPRNDSGGLWQWLTQSQTRMVGLILLVLAFTLFLALMVLLSQKSFKKKAEINIPQATPTTQTTQNTLPALPSPAPDQTINWTQLTNANGFKIKYPPGSIISPNLPQATTSATLQIASDKSTLAVEVVSRKEPLKELVNLLREKNATTSAGVKVNKVLTKPISILYGGNEGYEWYLESDGLNGFTSVYHTRMGKNRVIQFNKNNKHYLIFSSFNDQGEQLLSTFK